MKDFLDFRDAGQDWERSIVVALLSLVTLWQGSYLSSFPEGRVRYLTEHVESGLIEQMSDDRANAIFNAMWESQQNQ